MKRKNLTVGQTVAFAPRVSFGTPDINSPLLKAVVLSTDPYQSVNDYNESERRRRGYYWNMPRDQYPKATFIVNGVEYNADGFVKREQGPGRVEVLVAIHDGDRVYVHAVKQGQLFGPTYEDAVATYTARDTEIQNRQDAEKARKDADEALGRRLFDALGERYPTMLSYDDPQYVKIDVHVLADLMDAAGRI
jgi:hypothetical protein